MGYSYGQNYRTGRWLLACDACGTIGGVRKRTCPYKVRTDSLRSKTRITLPWCPAPALCGPCYAKHGPAKVLHADCAKGAAADQARADATQALLDAGHKLVVSASMVGEGQVEVTFAANHYADHETLTMPEALYDKRRELGLKTLADYEFDGQRFYVGEGSTTTIVGTEEER